MKNRVINHFKARFMSKSENEGFSRILITGFVSEFSPTVDELADIKTIVSEAVTNSIVHGYKDSEGYITLEGIFYDDRLLKVVVTDKGVGIENIEKAREPLFTTDPLSERTGMGFSIMECFTDKLIVKSSPGKGTRVEMRKKLSLRENI